MALSDKALATRQRILDAATELFYLHGYHATGLDKVIRLAGITKGNFYYHFASKEELAIATLEWQFEKVSREIKEHVLNKDRTPLDTLFVLLEYMASRQKQQHQEGHICGCYFGNFTLELSTISQSVRGAVKGIFHSYLQMIEALLVKAVAAGQVAPDLDPGKFAAVILGQVEGAILLDKANQKPEQFDASIEFIKQCLNAA
ncbi:TetR/AcrR family transcriptional regulator [Thiolapillus sp.]